MFVFRVRALKYALNVMRNRKFNWCGLTECKCKVWCVFLNLLVEEAKLCFNCVCGTFKGQGRMDLETEESNCPFM